MKKIIKTDEEWQKILTKEQYKVMRQNATEIPGSNKYYHTSEEGVYLCAACGQEVFSSQHKYDSGSGWPSFYKPINLENISQNEDNSHGMLRVEIKCYRCDSHLGHVFTDGPEPTGLRYCINSVALDFKKE